MPMLLQTVEEIIVTKFQRQGYWMVFNRSYNDVHVFNRKPEDGAYLSEASADEGARAEFIEYMKTNFPEVKTYQVFDLVSLSYMVWPYLGSIAIDMDKGDAVYQALSEKYNDPELDGKNSSAVLWTSSYEHALKHHTKRTALIEAEFGDDD